MVCTLYLFVIEEPSNQYPDNPFNKDVIMCARDISCFTDQIRISEGTYGTVCIIFIFIVFL